MKTRLVAFREKKSELDVDEVMIMPHISMRNKLDISDDNIDVQQPIRKGRTISNSFRLANRKRNKRNSTQQ